MAQRAPAKSIRRRTGRTESITDLVKDLELLRVAEEDGTKSSMARVRDSRIEELKRTNGTLQEGYEKIVEKLRETRGRRHILKDYYLKIKTFLSDSHTEGNFLQQEGDFLKTAEECYKDLKNKKYTVFVAGATSAGKSSLINLLLNEEVLPTGVLQNTLTICEISYGAKKEAVLHFAKQGKRPLILRDIKSDTLKSYIEAPINDENWCKKIELKIPNSLLQAGVVIVDSPGIGDSKRVRTIALEYLPQASAFIYVINSQDAGGVQKDRLMCVVKKWKELYGGDKCKGLTADSALFVCNKWDDVEKHAHSPLERVRIQDEIISKLKKEIPKLREKSQVIKMSVYTATQIQQKFDVMSDDLSSLISGLQRLLPLCLEKKTEYFYSLISGCLKTLSDQVKAKVTNTKRSREDRLKAQQDVKVKLKKRREGASIEETEEALSKHVNNISKQVRSHLQQDEIRSAFCTWEEKDVPEINDDQRGNVEELKKIYDECVEQRLEEFLQNLENRDRLVAKAHDDLAERFWRGFFEFENDIREIDLVLVGETTDEVLLKTGVNPNKLRPPFDPRVRKFLFLTSIIFMPVLFPVGFAAGVLSAPVIGYLAVDKILAERHLRSDSCRVLTELSEDFLQKFIEKGISNRISKEFTEEEERISRIKRCYEGLVEKYEKRCKDLTTSEDEGKVKEIVENLSPLYAQLEDMSQKLTFDAIQHGIRVMSPSCIIDKKTLYYMETSRDKLGGGSFGEVYKGAISLPGRQIKEVAVKKLKDIPRAPNVASFLREADILMQLEHNHIVAFYGVVMDVQKNELNSLALVFELCFASLKNHIFTNEENIPWKTKRAADITCQWGIDILNALEFIHSKKIVHRDLKLDNVLITKDQQVKVADLGLATFKTVITGTVCGTPLYMAPEIWKLKIYDSKVDMYSFGLMMWEMWFGETASRELSSRSQEDVFRQTEKKRLCGEGRRVKFYPPSGKWIKLMLSCCNSDPGLRKTATESKDLMKELQVKPFEKEVQRF